MGAASRISIMLKAISLPKDAKTRLFSINTSVLAGKVIADLQKLYHIVLFKLIGLF